MEPLLLPTPKGTYTGVVKEAAVAMAKAGTGYIRLLLAIDDPIRSGYQSDVYYYLTDSEFAQLRQHYFDLGFPAAPDSKNVQTMVGNRYVFTVKHIKRNGETFVGVRLRERVRNLSTTYILNREHDTISGPRHGGVRSYRNFALYVNGRLFKHWRDDEEASQWASGEYLDRLIAGEIKHLQKFFPGQLYKSRVRGPAPWGASK